MIDDVATNQKTPFEQEETSSRTSLREGRGHLPQPVGVRNAYFRNTFKISQWAHLFSQKPKVKKQKKNSPLFCLHCLLFEFCVFYLYTFPSIRTYYHVAFTYDVVSRKQSGSLLSHCTVHCTVRGGTESSATWVDTCKQTKQEQIKIFTNFLKEVEWKKQNKTLQMKDKKQKTKNPNQTTSEVFPGGTMTEKDRARLLIALELWLMMLLKLAVY